MINKNIYFFTFLCMITFVLSQDKAEKIDQLITKYNSIKQFNGSILIAEDGEVIHKKGYGFANFEWDIKNDVDTKFRLASVTKQFTAMLIMLEVQDGNLDLHKPISNYIKNYPKKSADIITTHHLLTHTSGIPNYTSFPGFFRDKSRDHYSPQEMMELFWEMDLEFEVGSQYKYSNSGYHLLGVILENITGKKYDQLLTDRIFKPLGMNNSGYDWSKPLLKKRAAAYQKSGINVVNANYLDMSIPYSAGAIYSTVEDLYKWDKSLYENELLSEELTEVMFTPFKNGYAYGWGVREKETIDGDKYIETAHSGGINGFSTRLVRITSEKHLIILLDNTSGGKNSEIVKNIKHILFDEPTIEPKPSIDYLVHGKSGEDLIQVLKNNPSREREINRLGYFLLNEKRFNDAILVFEFNTQKHPKSANTYDSLGEAYLKSGDKEKSIIAYKKAYKTDPTFTSAVTALNNLGIEVKKKERVEMSLGKDVLKTYVGKYELQPNFILTVTLEGNQLITQATGQGKIPIYPESKTKFFVKVMNAQLQFNMNTKNKVESLTLFQGGREMVAKRLH